MKEGSQKYHSEQFSSLGLYDSSMIYHNISQLFKIIQIMMMFLLWTSTIGSWRIFSSENGEMNDIVMT